jgi:hypothetical protein
MVASDVDAKAFTFFVERVDMLFDTLKSVGLLIGDFESDKLSQQSAIALSRYRQGGTPYQFGRQITHLVDTVHFANSHVSRMLQLADLYAWCLQLCETTPSTATGMRAALANYVRSETRLLHPHRCKEFPGPDSWIQV